MRLFVAPLLRIGSTHVAVSLILVKVEWKSVREMRCQTTTSNDAPGEMC